MVQLDSNRIRTPQGRRILAHIDTDYQQVTPEQSADPIQKYRVGGLVIQNCLTINILQHANPPTSVPNFLGFFNPIPRTAMLSLTNDTEDLCAPSKHGTNLDNLAGQILTDKIITICILKYCNITLSKHACQVVCFFHRTWQVRYSQNLSHQTDLLHVILPIKNHAPARWSDILS